MQQTLEKTNLVQIESYRQTDKNDTNTLTPGPNFIIKGTRCFLEQETLPLLLSTGWFHERIRALFQNQTKIN